MPSAPLLIIVAPIALDCAALPASQPPCDVPVQADNSPALLVTSGQELLPISYSLAAMQDVDPQSAGTSSGQYPAENETDGNEIIVEGTYGPIEADPMESINAESYRITQELDQIFLEPVAYAYRDALPTPLRDGLGNVVRNLGEPVNALNFLLQLKVGKAVESLGRFAINSTLGLGGLIDIAEKPGIGLPYRRNGFANTMGFYGIGTGPYLYLPITGATTVRDVIGSGLDQALLPLAVGQPFNRIEYGLPYFVINSLDARLEVDEELQRIGATIDPYAARRDTYLYRRERDIAELKGEETPPPPAILLEVEGSIEPGEEIEDAESASGLPQVSKGPQPDLPEPVSAVVITRPLDGKGFREGY